MYDEKRPVIHKRSLKTVWLRNHYYEFLGARTIRKESFMYVSPGVVPNVKMPDALP